MIQNAKGITLIELLVVIAIIGIIGLLSAPMIAQYRSTASMRSAATDIIHNMRLARAMAIKEGRAYRMVFDVGGADNGGDRYLIGFDGNSDGALTTLNMDTFGICKDTDGDRLPNGDIPHAAPNAAVPECVKVVNLDISYGTNIIFGSGASGLGANVTFAANTLIFNPDGSTNQGVAFDANGDNIPDAGYTAVFVQNLRGGAYAESYMINVTNLSGNIDVRKWLQETGAWTPWQ